MSLCSGVYCGRTHASSCTSPEATMERYWSRRMRAAKAMSPGVEPRFAMACEDEADDLEMRVDPMLLFPTVPTWFALRALELTMNYQ